MSKPYFGDVFEQFGLTPHVNTKHEGDYVPVTLTCFDTTNKYFGYVSVHLHLSEETFSIISAKPLKYFTSISTNNMSLKGRDKEQIEDMLDYVRQLARTVEFT